jgi:hypothetical protein
MHLIFINEPPRAPRTPRKTELLKIWWSTITGDQNPPVIEPSASSIAAFFKENWYKFDYMVFDS